MDYLTLHTQVSRAFQDALARRGVSRTQFAGAVGVAYPTLVAFLSGTGGAPRVTTLERYARGLGQSVRYVIDTPAGGQAVAETFPDVFSRVVVGHYGRTVSDVGREAGYDGERLWRWFEDRNPSGLTLRVMADLVGTLGVTLRIELV